MKLILNKSFDKGWAILHPIVDQLSELLSRLKREYNYNEDAASEGYVFKVAGGEFIDYDKVREIEDQEEKSDEEIENDFIRFVDLSIETYKESLDYDWIDDVEIYGNSQYTYIKIIPNVSLSEEREFIQGLLDNYRSVITDLSIADLIFANKYWNEDEHSNSRRALKLGLRDASPQEAIAIELLETVNDLKSELEEELKASINLEKDLAKEAALIQELRNSYDSSFLDQL